MIPALNEVKTMSSREIAVIAETSHDSVLKTIRDLIKRGVVFGNETSYKHIQNGQVYPEFMLSYRDTMVVVSGYSAKMRAKIIDRWQELERLQKPALPNYQEALRQLADQLDVNVQQQALIAQQKPAVEFVERYVESSGNKGFRDVCKLLNVKENKFREFLIEQKMMYRLGGNLTPYGNHLDAGRFSVNAGISETDHAYTQAKFTPKGINWVAGLWAVHNLELGKSE